MSTELIKTNTGHSRKNHLRRVPFYIGIFQLLTATSNIYGQQMIKPASRQVNWQKMETTAFIHFTVNTFTNKEWGDGTESPTVFNPSKFDARQIISAIKNAGFKMAIITAKHHDGFCLWPSRYTDHTVAHSPWKNGKGDVVREISEACKEFGLKLGIYLSPWDRHEQSYGSAAYNHYYENQLTELLSNYGEIAEVWFDGAKGPNQKNMSYDFKAYWRIVRKLQPKAVIFSDIGPDARWVGNEKGIAGDPCWSTINTKGMAPGNADVKYLNTGDFHGQQWIPAETDVSIRPGWFYHSAEDSLVRTGKDLANLYYQSVGRNSQLLLNIPPNQQGLIAAEDLKSLKDFREILNETFRHNFAAGRTLRSLTDDDLNTYHQMAKGSALVLDLKEPRNIDRIMLQENICNGQRNEEARLEYWAGSEWKELVKISSIGYKRLLRFPGVTASKFKLTIRKCRLPVQLAAIGFYKASAKEE